MKKIIVLSAIVATGLTGYVLLSNVASAQGLGRSWQQTNNNIKGTANLGDNMLQARAQALGMSRQDLQNELNGGKTMADILQSKGLTLEQFHEKMEEQMKTYLQNLVTKGQITQAQADQRMQFIEQKHKSQTSPGTGLGMGRPGSGHGMMRGF